MSSKRRRSNGYDESTGKRKNPPKHARLYWYEHDSDAFVSLSPLAKLLYILLKYAFDGTNNAILCSWDHAAALIGCNRRVAARCLAELEDRGFIRLVQRGSFNFKQRHATVWRLTEFPTATAPATKDYRLWRPPVDKSGTDTPEPACPTVSAPANTPAKKNHGCTRGTRSGAPEVPVTPPIPPKTPSTGAPEVPVNPDSRPSSGAPEVLIYSLPPQGAERPHGRGAPVPVGDHLETNDLVGGGCPPAPVDNPRAAAVTPGHADAGDGAMTERERRKVEHRESLARARRLLAGRVNGHKVEAADLAAGAGGAP